MSLTLINAECKNEGGRGKIGFLVGSSKICYSGIFLCIFQFTLYEFFMFFPHLQMLINVNINDDNDDDDDDKKVVKAR